jgi:thymidylate synthase
MKQYLELLHLALDRGHYKEDRTGTGTYGVFGHQMRFDLKDGFPMVTTKRVPFKAVLSELLWFISGSTNCNDLRAILHGEEFRNDWSKKTIWDDNAAAQGQALGYEDGELGPVYGSQWRRWANSDYTKGSIDQLSQAIETLKTNPDSRRIIVSAWNPSEVDSMALPPCHALFQFFSRKLRIDERVKWHQKHNGGQLVGAVDNHVFLGQVLDKLNVPTRELSCQLYQRSCDLFLGVPFNIASYALLTHMVAQVTGHSVGDFVWTGGDCHVYANHVDQVKLQLTREPLELPSLVMNSYIKEIDQFKMHDFNLINYNPHDGIAAPMAI